MADSVVFNYYLVCVLFFHDFDDRSLENNSNESLVFSVIILRSMHDCMFQDLQLRQTCEE